MRFPWKSIIVTAQHTIARGMLMYQRKTSMYHSYGVRRGVCLEETRENVERPLLLCEGLSVQHIDQPC